MSRFITRPRLEAAIDTDDGKWILIQPLAYQSDGAGTTFVVPPDFQTDLASVPRLPFIYATFAGHAVAAAVLHDWLYTARPVPREMADAVFREAAGVQGVSGWRAWAMWIGVRAGGGAYWRDQAASAPPDPTTF